MTKLPVVLERVSKPKDRYLRWLSSRHAMRYRLGALGKELNVTALNLTVSRDGRLCYIKNPKAGCSTLTALISYYDSGAIPDANPHRIEMLRQGERHWEENLAAIKRGATVFSFVRHPLARARSAFINRIVDPNNRGAIQHNGPLTARGFSRREDLSYRFDVFLDYISDSMAEDPYLTDRHWRQQRFNIPTSILPVAFVGKLEDGIDNGMAIVAELSGCTIAPIKDSRFNVSSRLDFTLSTEQVAKIEHLYAEDYEAFGY